MANPVMMVRIAANIEELRKNLSEARGQIETTTQGMSRMVASFSGDKLIAQAGAMASAIQKVGGTSSLTSAEMARANAVFEKAADKLTALGKTEAAAMYRKLADETKRVAVETEQATVKTRAWGETFSATLAGFVTGQAIWSGLTGAFNAVVGAVVAVKDAVVGAVMSTANLGDLLLTTSKKFDVSVERASAWRYVAAQAGTSLDAIMSNVGKLQVQIGAGGDKVTKSLGALGTSLSAIRAMRPDEAFEQILVKLRDVPRESDRAAIGVGLFGKGFREVAQLTREDIAGMMSRFSDLGGTISTEMAIAGDAFNDARGDWNLIVERITTGVGSAILPAATAFTNIMVNAVQKTLNESGVSAVQFDAQLTRSFGNIVDIMGLMVRAIGFLVPAFGEVFGGKMLRDAASMVQIVSMLGLQWVATAKVMDLIGNQGRGSGFLSGLEKGLKDTLKAATDVGVVSAEVSVSFAKLGSDLDLIGAEMKGKGAAALDEVKKQIAASAAEIRKGQENAATGAALIGAAATGPVADLVKRLADLTIQIETAQAAGTSMAEIVRIFGAAALKTADEAKALGVAVKLSVESVAWGEALNKWRDYWKKSEDLQRSFNQQARDLNAAWAKDVEATALRAAKAYQETANKGFLGNQDALIAATKSTYDQIGRLTLSSVEFEIRQRQDAGAAIKATLDTTSSNYQAAADAIDQSTQVAVDAMIANFERANSKLKVVAQAFRDLGGSLGGKSGAVVGGFGDLLLQWDQINDSMLTKSQKTANKIAGAFAVAANIIAGLFGGSTNKWAAALVSGSQMAAVGAQIGVAWGGIGAGVGAAIGFVVGAIQGYVMAVKKMREANIAATEEVQRLGKELVKQYGSMEALEVMGRVVGVSIVGAFGDQSQAGLKHFKGLMDEFNARMGQLTEALDTYGLSWRDMGAEMRQLNITQTATKLMTDLDLLKDAGVDVGKAMKGMGTALNAVIIEAGNAGSTLPAKFTPIIQQMIEWGTLTDAAALSLLGYVGDAVPSIEDAKAAAAKYGIEWEKVEGMLIRVKQATKEAADAKLFADLTAAAEKYGIALKDMGEAFQGGSMKVAIEGLLKDFALLTSSGVSPDAAIRGMSKALNQLIIDAVATGTQLPETMRPMIEQMIRMGLVTEDAARAMLGLGADTTPTLADVTAAAERYGLTLDQLGPKVQQLRITEAGKQIAADFATLTAAGVPFETLMRDIVTQVTASGESFTEMSAEAQAAYLEAGGVLTTVTSGMRSEVQDVISKSLQMGLEIPASMRPMIEKMVEGGLLTNGMGENLRDLSGLTFATDLNKMFETLMTSLNKLIGTIAGDAGVGGALGKLPGMAEGTESAMTEAGAAGKLAFQETEVSAKNAAEKIKGCWERSGDFEELLAVADFVSPFDDGAAAVDGMTRSVDALYRALAAVDRMQSDAGATGTAYRGPAPSSDTYGPSSAFSYGSAFSGGSAYAPSAARGGDTFSVTVNNPVVRDDRDITRLTDDIIRRLPSRLRQAGY